MAHQNTADFHSFSRCSVYLEIFYEDQLLAIGTGLVARTPQGQLFLLTALHNLTGREPDGRCKSPTGALPNKLQLTGYYFQTELLLYSNTNNPLTEPPLFLQHSRGPSVDVGALALGHRVPSTSSLDPSFLDPTSYARFVRIEIAQMCFVVGYPEDLFIRHSANAVLPIWKTGHIASEPRAYVDDLPKLLIDAATCSGMSGSPVYARDGQRNRLLGIYTGRTSALSELGYVFSTELLLPIIAPG